MQWGQIEQSVLHGDLWSLCSLKPLSGMHEHFRESEDEQERWDAIAEPHEFLQPPSRYGLWTWGDRHSTTKNT